MSSCRCRFGRSAGTLDLSPLEVPVKSLVDLLELLLLESGRKSGAPTARDVQTLRRRVKHEGDSFITITLPKFCSDFERSLERGSVDPGAFSSFRKKKGSRGIPAFLQGFLFQVFDKDGFLLKEPSVICIRLIRQICRFGAKLLRPCSDERVEEAIEKFVECDNSVAESLPEPLGETFRQVAGLIVRELDLDAQSVLDSIVPTHGPGATMERITGNGKWNLRSWHRRLEDAGLEYYRYGFPCTEITEEDILAWPRMLEPEDEPPSRVVTVPKTLKSPRVIAVEPVCMQFAQQGLSRYLVRQLETCRLTSGHVNFRDQETNQGLALEASGSGNYATIDMSEASDRVSLSHVESAFERSSPFLEMMLACRSTRAQLPNGDIITLKKFASMGSALCFPVEALVFFVSIIASRLSRAGIYPTAQAVHSFGRDVFVYGDDLIVPADEAPAICEDLEKLGFKVNRSKSFWSGNFRESCGTDCYDNERVTPVYLRRDLPADRKDASGILSCVATANQLFQAGFHSASAAIRKAVEKAIGGKLPTVSQDSPAVGWHGHSEAVPPKRWNTFLHRTEHLCWTVFSRWEPDPLEGIGALAKCFRIMRNSTRDSLADFLDIPDIDEEHLDRSPRPYSLALKRRWVPSL